MYNLKFTTVTPVHISNGNVIGHNVDYITNKDFYVCKFNQYKFPETLSKIYNFDFSKNYKTSEINTIIKEKSSEFTDSDYEYKIKITPDFNNFMKRDNHDGRSEVLEFINTNGKFYIPASSVKGAILTILGLPSLGINHLEEGNIKEKFVLNDSDLLTGDKFLITRALRPPEISLIILKRNIEFNLRLTKLGKLNINELVKRSTEYSLNQINIAINNVERFASEQNEEEKGARLFLKALNHIKNKIQIETGNFINIGFGGTSWFKVKNGIPDQREKEEQIIPHTAFAINSDDGPLPLGWCKFEIEKL